MEHTIFISYSSKDKDYIEFVKPILQRLKLENGITFFQDIENIMPGEDFKEEIDKALTQTSITICFLSNHFFASEFIQKIELPLIEAMHARGMKVFPIYVEQVYITNTFLSKLNGMNYQNKPLSEFSDSEKALFMYNFEMYMRKVTTNTIKQHPKVTYNIVVVGKAGVGKSELINYIFDQQVAHAGIGTPITAYGFHRNDLEISGIPVCIWDSAGLEVGNHQRWLTVLTNELRERGPTKPVPTWFHTVLYCVQAPGSRIDPFEIEIIKKFLKEKYKVIIVLTKSYINLQKIEELKSAIQSEIQTKLQFAYVNSMDEELAETVISKSGKNSLLRQIEFALVDSLTERIPYRCIKFMEKEIEDRCDELCQYVLDAKKSLTINEIESRVTDKFNSLISDIISPTGKFQHIILRETKYTLGFYTQIARIIEDAIVISENENPINISVIRQFNSKKMRSFWELWGDEISDSLNWDISENWGEILNTTSKIVASPFVAIKTLFKGLFDFVNEKIDWVYDIQYRIRQRCAELQDTLQKEGPKIKEVFSTKIQELYEK
jgi:GTP-binding protein EngB required for normal cell division